MSEKRTLTIYVDEGRNDHPYSVLILQGIQRMWTRKGETLYHFRGVTAEIVVIATLPKVDRAAALRLAAKVVGGTVSLIHVDLTQFGTIKYTRRAANSSTSKTNKSLTNKRGA